MIRVYYCYLGTSLAVRLQYLQNKWAGKFFTIGVHTAVTYGTSKDISKIMYVE